MNHIYLVQDKENNVFGATFEEDLAICICNKIGGSYRMAEFFKNIGTEINLIAGPIQNEYLNRNFSNPSK